MPASSADNLPAFEHVIESHGRSVLRFCVARAGADRGEDCFQETMIAALRSYEQVRDPDAIGGWLLSIAARKTVDLHRARARVPTPVEDLEALLPAGEDSPPRDEALWRLVRALPAKQRQAVTLRYLGDLTHREIADVMQTSAEAARRSLFEGLKRLREDTP
ncbi:MAG: RNA polymerase sigma factor [Solirubrobacteraceae bacterium]